MFDLLQVDDSTTEDTKLLKGIYERVKYTAIIKHIYTERRSDGKPVQVHHERNKRHCSF